MRRVTDQDDFAGELLDSGDLAEHAARIEHGLPDEYAIVSALVDQHALAERVEIHIHDVADDEPARDIGGVGAQRPQPLSLGFERLVALQFELREAQIRLETHIVLAQRIARGDALAEPMPSRKRTFDGDLRRGRRRSTASDGFCPGDRSACRR